MEKKYVMTFIPLVNSEMDAASKILMQISNNIVVLHITSVLRNFYLKRNKTSCHLYQS